MSEWVNEDSLGYQSRNKRREVYSQNNVVQESWNQKYVSQKKEISKSFTKEEEEMMEMLFDASKNKEPKIIYSILKGKKN
jgi:hypothetical protein